MTPRKLDLDDHQRFLLMKFKRNLSDVIKPHHDDRFLVRWLRARSWNVEAAEAMLRKSLKWREDWEVDGTLRTWQWPEVIDTYLPYGVSGVDKEGAPVICVPFAGFDVVGILHSVSKHDVMKVIVKIVEENLEAAIKNGPGQLVVVFDMEGFNLRQYAWRPAADLVIHLLKIYEANYPEILKACYIINAPRVFAIAFNIVKRFLNEYTLGKIQIFKNDPKKWKKAIAENVDPDNLPLHFGGSLVDPDGNPRYTTKVKQGGKVPKTYYKKKYDEIPESEKHKEYTTVVVKKGDKLNLDYIVAEKGCFLSYDFRTEDHDIRFGITAKDADGNVLVPVEHKRVSAQHVEESGVIACQAPATYTVTFDNSYSVLRSKKLRYHIKVSLPLEKLNILPQDETAEEAAEQSDDTPSSSSDNFQPTSKIALPVR